MRLRTRTDLIRLVAVLAHIRMVTESGEGNAGNWKDFPSSYIYTYIVKKLQSCFVLETRNVFVINKIYKKQIIKFQKIILS